MNTGNVIHIYSRILSSLKNDEILSFVTAWMKPVTFIVSQSQPEMYMFSVIYKRNVDLTEFESTMVVTIVGGETDGESSTSGY